MSKTISTASGLINMNKAVSNIIGGLAGAVALNVIHQAVKTYDHDAPRVDLVGEEALTKGMKGMGLTPPTGDALFVATIIGDVISNAIYYSSIGFGKNKFIHLRGFAIGFGAGVAALSLTGQIGLKDAPITKTNKTKLMTVAWYTIGGLVAASVIKKLRK